MPVSNKQITLLIGATNKQQESALRTVGILIDALLNNATSRQCEVLYYKLLAKSEQEIANILGINQSGVNQHSTSAKWYCIEETLNFWEQLNFSGHE